MTEASIGAMMSAFFVGYILSSVLSPGLVLQVGHIRTFAALASVASAVALAHILLISPFYWSVFRAIHGFCYAGIILVVESWLNAVATSLNRGQILGLYGIVFMLANATSQALINVAPSDQFELFCIVSILLSIALVPVTLANPQISPGPVRVTRLDLFQLFRSSPVGSLGVFVVGLANSAFLGLGPIFAHTLGFEDRGVSLFIGLALAGAFCLQWPLGILSDKIDRRLIILGTNLMAIGVSYSLMTAVEPGVDLFGLSFLWGGLIFPSYSLCLAEAHDRVLTEETVAAASSLLLIYGSGACLGPLIAGVLITWTDVGGLFFFLATIEAFYALYTLSFILFREAVSPALKQAFILLPQRSTHLIFGLRRTPILHQREANKLNRKTG